MFETRTTHRVVVTGKLLAGPTRRTVLEVQAVHRGPDLLLDAQRVVQMIEDARKVLGWCRVNIIVEVHVNAERYGSSQTILTREVPAIELFVGEESITYDSPFGLRTVWTDMEDLRAWLDDPQDGGRWWMESAAWLARALALQDAPREMAALDARDSYYTPQLLGG